MKNTEDVLFFLITLGLGNSSNCIIPQFVDWQCLFDIANRQSVSAICLDGLQNIVSGNELLLSIPKHLKVQWIASSMRQERKYAMQWDAAKLFAELYCEHDVQTFVIKGFSLSEMYPKPNHRQHKDMDCFLVHNGNCAYETGNIIAEENGLKVNCQYYKHSKILFHGLTIENHQYLLPIKGSGKTKKFERDLRYWIDDGHNDYIGDSRLKTTSPFFDAVYVLAHAQEHFLNEGFVLQHICDWAMVLKKYTKTIDWQEWKRVCNEYGLLPFGYAMSRLANKVCGVAIPFDCPHNDKADRLLLNDTLYRKTNAEGSRSDMQVRIDLVKNMFCNSWKYRMFSDTNFFIFFARRVWGYLFDKE